MDVNVMAILEKVLDQLQNEVKTETIIGEEFKLGEYTLKPVMKVGMGFGGGGGVGNSPGKGEGSGGGAGAGIGISPVGFLATKGDEIKMIPAGGSKGLAAMFEKLPDVLDRAIELKWGNEGEKKESTKGSDKGK